MGLFLGEGLDDDSGAADQRVELAPPASLVVEQFGVIDRLAFEGPGAAAADREQLGGCSLGSLAAADALQALSQSLGDRFFSQESKSA